MLRSMYNGVLRLAASRHAASGMAAVSFAESSFFPLPPDIMLAPMVLTRPDRAYFYAALCTAASVLGGIAGYAIGYFLEPVGLALLRILGHAEGLEVFREWYDKWGVWVILAKGVTPIPYKLVTIASGLAAFNFPVFIAASVLTRGVRFFAVAYLIKRYGPAVQEQVEKRLYLTTGVLLALIVGALVVVRFLG